MRVNIFFCNGFMSALSSCFISDHLYESNPNDLYVLCIEQNGHVDPVYYQALDVLVQQNRRFTKVIRVKADFRAMSIRNPISYMKSVGYYKGIATDVFNKLGEETSKHITTIWAPTTSRLWPFFKRHGVKFNVIEHGIGEYISAKSSEKPTLKRLVIDGIGWLSGYPAKSPHDSVWLCSDAVMHSIGCRVVQHNYAVQFSYYVERFWVQYQKSFPVAAQELQLVAAKLERRIDDSYLYLPGDEIRYDHYHHFVKDQTVALGLNNSPLFIIKRHPGDTHSDYAQLLAQHGSCVVISELINSYIPVEFVATILRIKHVVGSCSSALFYLKSWEPNIKLHIYNNFDEELLKPECAGLIQSLASVGLTIKQAH